MKPLDVKNWFFTWKICEPAFGSNHDLFGLPFLDMFKPYNSHHVMDAYKNKRR